MIFKRPYLTPGILLMAFLLKAVLFAAPSMIIIDDFSGDDASNGKPAGWQTAWFDFSPRRTRYTVVNDNGKPVLKAESRNSASAIYREVLIDPATHPVLAWRWKVSNIIKNGDERTKKGDDYAARLYVAFEFRRRYVSIAETLKRRMVKALYGKELPGETIEYVWANKLPKNTAVPNPDTDKAMMLAVESGPEKAGVWMYEKRNVLDDYKRLFGAEPPNIVYIAIMTDTDNTGEAADAWYGDIIFYSDAGESTGKK